MIIIAVFGDSAMKLKFVTLTGADDRTDSVKMAELSTKYKFVEWAILFSQSKAGVPRYPSLDWIESAKSNLRGANLAAHLCGKWVDDANKGRLTFFDVDDGQLSDCFNRVQLNMATDKLKKVLKSETLLCDCCLDDSKQIILGGPYQKYNLHIPTDLFMLHNVVPLFDCSGGRGVLPDSWPQLAQHEYGNMFCGYAGGLGPDNLEEQLKKIESVVGDATIWIDMESKVRNEKDEFDLNKCEQVLQIAKSWVE